MFTSKRGIEFHLAHHTETDLVRCDFCDDYFSHEDNIEHEKCHDVLAFGHKCVYCVCRKKQKCDINKHMNKSCVKNTSRNITCKCCEKDIIRIPMLLEHLQKEHESTGSHFC